MEVQIPRYCNKCGKRFIFIMEEERYREFKGTMSYLCGSCGGSEMKIRNSNYVPDYISTLNGSRIIPKRGLLGLTAEQFANLPTINQADIISKMGASTEQVMNMMAGRNPVYRRVIDKFCNNCGKPFIYKSERLWEPDPIYLCPNCL